MMTVQSFSVSVTLWIAGAILALLMIRGAWRGYRRGPMRQLAGPIALAAGQLAGWMFGGDLGHTIFHGTSYPWMLRGITGVMILACITGLICYALFWRIGRLPEGQEEAESPVMGALVGCWTGILYFLILIGLLAAVASVYELFEKPGETKHHWTIEIRNELADTPYSSELKNWSPIPEKQRILIRQTKRLMADPDARRRLMLLPEIKALATHTSFYQAWEDKKVRELLNNNDLVGFIDHPKVRAVLADEEFQKDAEKLDLLKNIEQSLQKPKK